MIQLSINGAMREFAEAISISQMIIELELSGKRIAIERNGEIVPKSQYEQTVLQNGDVLEMVVAVGGG